MKKFGLSLLFTLGLSSLAIISCCRENKDYWKLVTMNIELFSATNTGQSNIINNWSKLPINSGENIVEDTIIFNIQLVSMYTANHNSIFNSLSRLNSAFATPKCEPGMQGIKHKAQNVKLTSNEEFMGVPSGEQLNDFTLINTSYNDTTISFSNLSTETFNQLLKNLSHFEKEHTISIGMVKIDSTASSQKFHLEVLFENGEVLKCETITFNWE